MTSGMMWMGPRGGEGWVPAPVTGNDFTPVGFSDSVQNLNGGLSFRKSTATHMEYNMAWNPDTRNRLRPIGDMFHGMQGDGLIYFIDPMVASYNVLPRHWSVPAMANDDAPILIGSAKPGTVPTSANTLGYPAKTATYMATGTPRKLYVPIPPGYCAWAGVHGAVGTGSGVQVTPFIGTSAQTATTLTPLAVTNPTRVNASFDSATGYTGLEVSFITLPTYTNLIGNPKALNDTTGWSVWFGSGTAQTLSHSTYTSSSVGMPAGGATTTGAAIFGPSTASALPSWCALGINTSASGLMTANAQAASVTPGQTYTIAAIYDFGILPTTVGLDAEWFDSTGARLSASTVTTPSAPTTGWNLLKGTAVAPAGAAYGGVLVYLPAGVPATMNGHATGVLFTPGTAIPQTFFDGDYAGGAWLGANNESASTFSPGNNIGLNLSGMMLQILPSGQTPATGRFISGGGHSGCEFETFTSTAYTAVESMKPQVGVTAKLVETGDWE